MPKPVPKRRGDPSMANYIERASTADKVVFVLVLVAVVMLVAAGVLLARLRG